MNDMNNYNGFNSYDNSNTYTTAKPGVRKMNGGKRLLVTALCCSLLGGAVGAGGTVLGMKLSGGTDTAAVQSSGSNVTQLAAVSTPAETAAQPYVSTAAAETAKQQMSASDVYRKNVNSVVSIMSEISTVNYYGYQTQGAASGSGFIISEDGYIITNHHVIEDASSITVTMYDGTSYKAELIGSDAVNDIAVLKIDAQGLTPVVVGSSDDLSVGDDVVAIGNPLGELTFSLTAGVVSALDRAISLDSSMTMELIQTDCAINSGNSGGALFNLYGEVVGITNAKYSSSGMTSASIDNIAFAIPIDNVMPIVNSLISDGHVDQAYIGISVTNAAAEGDSPIGALVKSVEENGTAAQAGLKAEDIITAVDGETVRTSSELIAKIRSHLAGDEITLDVYRDGEKLSLTVTVGAKDTEQSFGQQSRSSQSGNERSSGGFPGWGSLFGY